MRNKITSSSKGRKFPYCIVFLVSLIIFSSCNGKQSLEGSWKLSKVKMWNGYRNKTIEIELNNKSFYVQEKSYNTEDYRDSLFKLMKESYLQLNRDSTFQLSDYGFFVSSLSDKNWHGRRNGIWKFNDKKSILSLHQANGLAMEYKLLLRWGQSMKIGELYPQDSYPISEITLIK